MTRDEIEAAAREAGLRVTEWHAVADWLTIADFGPIHAIHIEIGPRGGGPTYIAVRKERSGGAQLCRSSGTRRPLSRIRADIDEIAAVRIPGPSIVVIEGPGWVIDAIDDECTITIPVGGGLDCRATDD